MTNTTMRLPADTPDNAAAVSARFAAVQSGQNPQKDKIMTDQESASHSSATFAAAQRPAPAADSNPEHYVTVNDGTRMANALGPYLTDDDARANLPRVRAFLNANDTNADAYEYGTFRVRSYGRTLGPGRLNDRIGLHAAEEPTYTIEVTTRVVSTEAEECAYAAEDDHDCTGDCLSLDGDVRELEEPSTEEIAADADDLEAHDGDPVAWAADYIRSKTDATEVSSSPIGDTAREHEWLSGTYTDPHNNAKETHTTVRLTGDWTEEQRARVFTAATTF
ncbi:hypothetical protein [Streptomyces sp. MH60]|uniref:hypothetical protein n=1 Tax=Streptomyces sp. MH60 TaxID=1940758 RepID=UPI000D483A89|nr:hypothetical protein [Streptomyces sp. MH60]PPS89591.1 hypothetical protein BZZ08_01738 [Streptomyces sp. MH60]